MINESGNDQLNNRHPYLYYWLTGGLATILAAVVTVLATSGSSTHKPPKSSAQNLSESSAQNAAGEVARVPPSYQGTWQGILSYSGSSEQISLELGPGSTGAEVGQATNTTYDCQGSVYLVSSGGQLLLHYVLTSNPMDRCVSYGNATATLQGPNSLNFAFVADPNTGIVPAAGTLTRTG